MDSHLHSVEGIEDRLVKLEKQNRLFKQLGAIALIIPVLLLVVGQAPSKKTVEANEFVVRDSDGKLRVTIGVNPRNNNSAEINLLDENGDNAVSLYNKGILFNEGSLIRTFLYRGGLKLANSKGETRVSVSALDGTGAFVWLTGEKKGGLIFDAVNGGSLEISDNEGFEAAIGNIELKTPRTGESRKTSAASLMLFDKEKNVMWKAP